MRKSTLPVWSEISQLKNLQWGDPYCLYVYHFAPGSTDVLIGSFWFFFIFLVLFEEKRYPSWGILYEEIHIICMMIISRDFEVFRNILDEESSMSVCELFCPRLHCRSFWIPFFIFLVLFEENREVIPQQIYPSWGISNEDISTLSVCKLFCPRLHCQSPTLMTS